MADETRLPSARRDRSAVWVLAVGALAGIAGLYFISNERGRQWLASLDVVASGLDGDRVRAPSGPPRG